MAIKFPFYLKQKLAKNKSTKGSKAWDKAEETGVEPDKHLLQSDYWRLLSLSCLPLSLHKSPSAIFKKKGRFLSHS